MGIPAHLSDLGITEADIDALADQAIADVCGREVSVAKVTVGACFGDAIMAALAGGAYASWDELAQVLGVAQTIVPDMAAHELYASRRHIFDELYARNRDLMHELV